MFQALKQWFGFAAKKEAADTNKLAVCLRSLAELPPALSLQDKIIVVCKGSELALRKEGALPDRLNSGEVCWILPGGDVRLPIEFQYESQEIQAVVMLRFEGDRRFASYAANLLASGRSGITESDLAQFVAGQWSELLTLQNVTAEQLTTRNSEHLARFRTHLSLLLQENGFRCAGIESVEILAAQTSEVQAAELPNTASQELNEAVRRATTESDWNRLLDQLDEAGFQPCESDAATLETLGDDYRNRKLSAEDTALQIRRMIERNNLETRRITERVAHWNAAEIKLRLLNSLYEKQAEYLLAAAESLDKPGRVPSTWYLLRHHKVDEKLQEYMKTTTRTLGNLLVTAMKRQSGLENKAKLASSQATLKRIADKLVMTPSLGSAPGDLRKRQRKLDELVQAVRRSVTATQLAEGLLRNLVAEDYPKEQFLVTVADLESTLATLEREIDDRKNVYSV